MKRITVVYNDKDYEELMGQFRQVGGNSLSRFIRDRSLGSALTEENFNSAIEDLKRESNKPVSETYIPKEELDRVFEESLHKKKLPKKVEKDLEDLDTMIGDEWSGLVESGIILVSQQVKEFKRQNPKGYKLDGSDKWGWKVVEK